MYKLEMNELIRLRGSKGNLVFYATRIAEGSYDIVTRHIIGNYKGYAEQTIFKFASLTITASNRNAG